MRCTNERESDPAMVLLVWLCVRPCVFRCLGLPAVVGLGLLIFSCDLPVCLGITFSRGVFWTFLKMGVGFFLAPTEEDPWDVE